MLPGGTFIVGNGWERVQSVYVVRDGFIYIAGTTNSPDFSTFEHACQRGYKGGGNNDGYVAKLAPDGTRLIWSTFLNGSERDDVYVVRVDNQGYVYVTGWTGSTEFLATDGALNRRHDGEMDIFVTKLLPDGSDLIYSTLISGSGIDQCRGAMAIDDNRRLYLAGYTDSEDFPTMPGGWRSWSSGCDGRDQHIPVLVRL